MSIDSFHREESNGTHFICILDSYQKVFTNNNIKNNLLPYILTLNPNF